MNHDSHDTIFALATAPGRSGVAVIRVSGRDAEAALAALGVDQCPAPRSATFARLWDASGQPIDDALLLWFPSPASFTGENVLELHTHGSRAVIARCAEILSGLSGFRLAEPGEFSRRALLNGKMDLAEAEGLADLINAETSQQGKQALHFMQGDASKFYRGLRDHIVSGLAQLEALIDFPDEDIPPQTQKTIDSEIHAAQQVIENLLKSDRFGEKIRDGFHIALLGGPNVGKSSLLNVLAKRDVAIVSHIAGTTRDVIELHMDIGGYAVTLADTAGIRQHGDEIEKEGIKRSLARSQSAEFTIVVFDAHDPEISPSLLELIDERSIVVLNKCDDGPLPASSVLARFDPLPLSAKTGFGIDALLTQLMKKLEEAIPSSEPSFISRPRHRSSLSNALNSINKYWISEPLELRSEELRLAARELGKITGAIDIEDLLDEIFRQFCIGK